jgi:hypothetical protein
MAKTHKRASAPGIPVAPQVGDKVKPGRSEMVYESVACGKGYFLRPKKSDFLLNESEYSLSLQEVPSSG